MGVLKSAEHALVSSSGGYANEGTTKVVTRAVIIRTSERTEFINISEDIRAFVEQAGISDGYLQIMSMHTTTGLFINEWQDALLSDIKFFLERLVPRKDYYKHNDPEFSDCYRKNADSHLLNTILGRSLSIPITRGEIMLGQWQSIILAEFDGPNERKVFLQVLGIA